VDSVRNCRAALPESDDDGKLTNARIATYIAEHHPIEYSAQFVGTLRQTARAFEPKTRVLGLSFTAHRMMRRTPRSPTSGPTRIPARYWRLQTAPWGEID
jgi:hypothetical protein